MDQGLAQLITIGATAAAMIGGYFVYLPTQNWPTLIDDLGEDKGFLPKVKVSVPIQVFKEPEKGAHVRIMNGHKTFLGSTIMKSPEWVEFLYDHLNIKEGKVTVYGHRELTGLKEVDHLRKTGLEYFVVDPSSKQFLISVDKPRQLWMSGYNTGRNLYKSYYSDNPSADAWDQSVKFFEWLEHIRERQVIERKYITRVRKPIQ